MHVSSLVSKRNEAKAGFLGTSMRSAQVRVERVLWAHILQKRGVVQTIVDGNKVVSSLGPSRGTCGPRELGTPVALGALCVEAQRDRQPIGCVLTGAWQGGVSVRSDQARPPCMHACEQRLTLLDKEPAGHQVTGGEYSATRRTGPSTGIDMPADTRGLGLDNATCLAWRHTDASRMGNA